MDGYTRVFFFTVLYIRNARRGTGAIVFLENERRCQNTINNINYSDVDETGVVMHPFYNNAYGDGNGVEHLQQQQHHQQYEDNNNWVAPPPSDNCTPMKDIEGT